MIDDRASEAGDQPPSALDPAAGAPPALEVADLRKVFAIRGGPGSDLPPATAGSTLLGRGVLSRATSGSPRRVAADHLVAVDDISFSVPQGRSLAIVGESGSGKTTVARMIVGLERPTEGRITVGGRERSWRHVTGHERKRRSREVQIIFQDPYSSLDPRQTVRACINELLRLHFDWDARRRADRVGELLDQVGLGDREADALPKALSGGQRQRAAIARALACQPQVLICDEAVASLDVSIQAQVLNLLNDIQGQTGVTYLFISHDLAVVRQVSDEVMVMRRGRMVEAGPVDQVLTSPQDAYTRRLLDAIPRADWRPSSR